MARPQPYLIGNDGRFKWGIPTGTEIYPVFYVPGEEPLIMGSVDTITYSMHREKIQVRPCGRVSPGGVIRGKRTIAGTLIFKMFNGNELKSLLSNSDQYYNSILADELPPFTIVITIPLVGEGGDVTSESLQAPPYVIVLTGVEIVDQAFSLSIDDTVIEQSFSYIARDIIDLQDSRHAIGGGITLEDVVFATDADGLESSGRGRGVS